MDARGTLTNLPLHINAQTEGILDDFQKGTCLFSVDLKRSGFVSHNFEMEVGGRKH